MMAPLAYFTWEATTDQLRWDDRAAHRLGLAREQLESLSRWSEQWQADEPAQLSRIIVEASRERPEPIDMIVHQHGENGTVRALRLFGDWVDGLICGIVTDVAAAEAIEPASMIKITRQFTHDIAQPLAAASNYLAALEMIAGQAGADAAWMDMTRNARQQVTRAGALVRDLRERMIDAETD